MRPVFGAHHEGVGVANSATAARPRLPEPPGVGRIKVAGMTAQSNTLVKAALGAKVLVWRVPQSPKGRGRPAAWRASPDS